MLQRRSGYRELLEHPLALILAARYPIRGADLTRLLQAKEASLLYRAKGIYTLSVDLGDGVSHTRNITPKVGSGQRASFFADEMPTRRIRTPYYC